MARPRKRGIDYFSFDTDFFSDMKIKLLNARYGADGITLYLYLLCEVYREGYYLEWCEDTKFIVGHELNMKPEKVGQIMKFLLERSLFNNKLFQSDTIITSTGIQKRYQEAVEARGRKDPVKINKYWLLTENETKPWLKVNQFSVSPENNSNVSREAPENNNSDSQEKVHKVKKSKVKEIESKNKGLIAQDNFENSFNEFWNLYPRKVGKGKCRAIWKKLNPSKSLLNKIMAALTEQKQSEQWIRDNGQFIPHPATWLNQSRWEDEPDNSGANQNTQHFVNKDYSTSEDSIARAKRIRAERAKANESTQ